MPPMRLKEMNEVKKIKCLSGMMSVLMACVFAFMPSALADSGENASPEYATVSISIPEVDINAMISTFYGAQASELKLKTEVFEANGQKLELTTGTLPDNEFAFSFDGCGIDMTRDHKIPLRYRSDDEGVYLPPPSKIEGKYTQDEAIELARSFVQDELGMAKSGLKVMEVEAEDESKERSRAYNISFAYSWEGIPLVGHSEQLPMIMPNITVGVTDEGVVSVSGDILELSGAKQGGAKLLSLEEIKSINPSDKWLAKCDSMYLCYKVGPAHEGRLTWNVYEEASGTEWTYVALGYDAYTGEKLT